MTSVHILSSLGVEPRGGATSSRYRAKGWTGAVEVVEALVAPQALARLLPNVGRVTLLVTREALPYAERVQREMGAGLVSIEEHGWGATPDEQQALFSLVLGVLERSSHLPTVIDMTQGLRHLPLVIQAATAFHAGREGGVIAGAYSAMFEARDDEGTIPVVNLGPTLGMFAWGRALERARVSADWRGVAEQVRVDVHRGRRVQSTDLAVRIGDMAASLHAGLPLEAGCQASELQGKLRTARTPHPRNPDAPPTAMVLAALDRLEQLVGSLATPAQAKADVRLDADELDRQLGVAKTLASGNPGAALLVLREWLVNWALLARGQPEDWLKRATRVSAERALWRAGEQTASGGLWAKITQVRNPRAHAGMCTDNVTPTDLAALLLECAELARKNEFPELAGPDEALRVLVTPLGLSPGVLLTLLVRAQQHGGYDALVICTTPEATAGGREALSRANSSAEPLWIVVEDAVTAADAPQRTAEVRAELESLFRRATSVVVNTTGGTSLLQHLAATVGRLAEGLVYDLASVERVAAYDRRPYDEIRSDPWRVGEVLPLPDILPQGPG